MKTRRLGFREQYLAQARYSLAEHHLPRISRCLKLLAEKDIWWRLHPTSNSVGNLVLHLSGNVRQWIISGLGGAPDRRERKQEFAERGPMPRRTLQSRLQKTVHEAVQVINRLSSRDLSRVHSIQGFRVTGLEAIYDVLGHFAYHTGQIIFITKLRLRKDTGFTRLPGEKRQKAGTTLPALQIPPRRT